MNETKSTSKRSWKSRTMIGTLVCILMGGFLFTGWTIRQSDRYMRDDMLYQARLVAQAVNIRRILLLSGSNADLTAIDYLQLKEQLAFTRKTITDCKFIYLLGRRENGSVFFFVDSEPPGSKDESPAGQLYEEISDEDLRAFEEKRALTTGPASDRWGTWISALVPLIDSDSGDLVAVLGMDFSARDWQRKLLQTALPPVLLTLVTIALWVVGACLVKRRAFFAGLVFHRQSYQEIMLAIILAGIFLSLAATWTTRTFTLHTREHVFRQVVQEKTAAITMILHTLHHIELEALARFFEASEHVSPGEFDDYTDYLVNNPVIQAWSWAQWIPVLDRQPMEKKIRAEGLPDFSIWQWDGKRNRIPVPERNGSYCPIVHTAPPEEKRGTLGFDLASDPLRRRVLETAARSGLTTCTVPIGNPMKPDRPAVVQVFRPVFAHGDASRLRGFALADLQPAALLESAHPTQTMFLELAIDISQKTIQPIAVSGQQDSLPDVRFTVKSPIFVFGKAFLFTARAATGFFSLYPVYPAWPVAIAGLVLTFLLAGWFGLVHHKREQLELMIDERTRDWVDTKNRMELALHGADLGTWDWHIPSDKMIVNENWANMVGYQLDEIVPLLENWRELIAIEDRPAVFRAMELHLKGQAAFYEFEHRLRHKVGYDIWVLAKGRVIERSPDGKPLRVCGTCLDTTAHHKVKERIRLSEEKFSKIFAMAPDVIAITRLRDGKIIDVNIGFEETTGWKRDEVIGRTSNDIHFWADPSGRADMVAELRAGREVLHREMEFFRKDGTRRTGIYSARMIRISDELTLIFILQDTTRSRRLEAERRKLEAQLQQSQKLEAIGVLAGGVAHDFNNMLGAIIGYAELAMQTLDSSDPMHKNFYKILDAAQRSANLTRQLLAFARKQTVEPVVLDINAAIEGILKMLRRIIGENIELAWMPASGQCTVRMDPSQLDQILANLCVNARDAIEEVGKVTIKTGKSLFDEDSCMAFADCLPGEYVRLSVSDDGCGMDRETQDHIFEPFFTTKEIGQGTGLGMATVYGIVKQNEGFIQLSSKPGIGTTFDIYLPRQSAKSEIAGSDATGEAIPRSRGETVLMVEDDPTMREMGLMMLQRLGYKVLPAATPGEAIRCVEEDNRKIHLFIIDVVMPEMNGRELADQLLEIRPGMKHLFMSGYTADVIAHRGVLDEGVNFIQKPFSLKDLAVKIREVLE